MLSLGSCSTQHLWVAVSQVMHPSSPGLLFSMANSAASFFMFSFQVRTLLPSGHSYLSEPDPCCLTLLTATTTKTWSLSSTTKTWSLSYAFFLFLVALGCSKCSMSAKWQAAAAGTHRPSTNLSASTTWPSCHSAAVMCTPLHPSIQALRRLPVRMRRVCTSRPLIGQLQQMVLAECNETQRCTALHCAWLCQGGPWGK